MKRQRHIWPRSAVALRSALTSTVLAAALLCGCHRSPYSILERQEGRAVKAVSVEVAPGATEADLSKWAGEVESQEKVAGKGLLVNFYDGEMNTSHLIGSYLNGHLSTSTNAR